MVNNKGWLLNTGALGSLAIRISRKADKREDGRWYRRYVGTIRRDFLRSDRSRQRAAPASWCWRPPSDLATRRRAAEPREPAGRKIA